MRASSRTSTIRVRYRKFRDGFFLSLFFGSVLIGIIALGALLIDVLLGRPRICRLAVLDELRVAPC